MVPEERIELSGAQGPADFESAAFTNFTTPALNEAIYSNYIALSICVVSKLPKNIHNFGCLHRTFA